MKTLPTYVANINIGLQEGYVPEKVHTMDEVLNLCKGYCNRVKLGVTVTSTKFVYTDGSEPGVIVGLINYPRFPVLPAEVKRLALVLAKILMREFKQERCSVICTDETVMLEKCDL